MVRMNACLLAAGLAASVANADVTLGVDQSSAPWLAYMNVFELPANGGAFVFGSGWGVPDLNATFDDGASTLTLSPNTVGDPDPFWYQGGGAPGNPGNKLMEANLYQEVTDTYGGQTVTFEGIVDSNTFTAAHSAIIFIKDYAADYSSFTQTSIAVTAGAFSVSHVTSGDAGRHVQWGFQVTGENVWAGDEGPFGSAVISTVPTPASAALIGLGGLVATRRRRA